jgi:hypothetical protein
MPDRIPDEAAVRNLIAECRKRASVEAPLLSSGSGGLTNDHEAAQRFEPIELQLARKVQHTVQQGMDLGILDEQGCLQVERLVARGLLSLYGQVMGTSSAGGCRAHNDDCHGASWLRQIGFV